MDLNEAVRKLREKTGDSQQLFATGLGLSIRAIVNYEKDRTPSAKALAALAHLAAKHGEFELANQFWSALPVELASVPLLTAQPGCDPADVKIQSRMLPRPFAPLPERGAEVTLSDPRRLLERYARDLDRLISGDAPAISGAPAATLRQVAEGLKRIVKFLGQKVRVQPAKVVWADIGPKKTNE